MEELGLLECIQAIERHNESQQRERDELEADHDRLRDENDRLLARLRESSISPAADTTASGGEAPRSSRSDACGKGDDACGGGGRTAVAEAAASSTATAARAADAPPPPPSGAAHLLARELGADAGGDLPPRVLDELADWDAAGGALSVQARRAVVRVRSSLCPIVSHAVRSISVRFYVF